MPKALIAIIVIVLTMIAYLCMNRLYQRYRLSFLIPALTTACIIIVILLAFDIPYTTYMVGGTWIDFLLGPAVVSLAYPLYNQRALLAKHALPILGGVIIGSITGIMSGLLFTQFLGYEKELILSLLPKSITTPVAMQIASTLGGAPSLAAVFVMIAGFTGVVLGPYLFKLFRLHSSLGRGIALGSASHAIGTSKALEYGEETVSISSVAMTLSAIFGSIFGPLIVWLCY